MAAWMLPAAIIGSSLIGGVAAKSAGDTQAAATREASAAQERMFGKQVELQEPFRQVGVNALPELVAASKYEPFTMAKFQADPGYAFRLKEGLKALDRSAAARGGLLSGAQLRGITEYGQELGSQEFTNAFNRYQAERAARLNPLQSLTGMGLTTAANVAGAAGRLGENIGSNIIGGGAARASSYMGMANALSSGLGQYLAYDQNQMRNARDQQYIDLLRSGQNTYFNPPPRSF
jgi:hypothetical protein